MKLQQPVAADVRRGIQSTAITVRLLTNGGQSGIGLPHSKTLRKECSTRRRDSVLECGSPMPLFPHHARALVRLLASCCWVWSLGFLTSTATCNDVAM